MTVEVTLTGSKDCRQTAKQLIEELTDDSAPRSYGGNSYGGNSYGGNSYSAEEPQEEKPRYIDFAEANRAYEKAQKERWAQLPPLKKNFYVEDPGVAAMLPEEVANFRKVNNNITASYALGQSPENSPIPNPVQTFEQCFSEYPEILTQIYNQSFTKPSPIQSQAWPILLKGLDLIGVAQTGTGKTLAFLLPGLIHTDLQPIPRSQRGGPNVLVLAPTRELALQIEKEVKKYNYRDIKSVCIYGGGSRRDQVNIVKQGVEIIIATPGRLNDLVQAGANSLRASVTSTNIIHRRFRMRLAARVDRRSLVCPFTWKKGMGDSPNTALSEPQTLAQLNVDFVVEFISGVL
uniref:Helicase ATP-binding domain-containing protein n=1 Tax=Timema cristinae TaxID=61476 RepID=A0A7R9DDC0_TIMCR|nr:unnamed protein product [Timema cristinae]